MVRYVAASLVAKGFSVGPRSRSYYRALGNRVESWRRNREGLPDRYLVRAISIVEELRPILCERADPPIRVLELGTGWVHWEGLAVSLAYDCHVTLLDIVDNRLFSVFQRYCDALAVETPRLGLPSEREHVARELLKMVASAASFEEVYSALNWTYLVDPTGTGDALGAEPFDVVVSWDVLEHVQVESVLPLLQRTYDLMRPGGIAIHSVDLRDHLSYFDPRESPKRYYEFAGARWDRLFNSEVQYINRLQRPDWLSMFEQSGFQVLSERVEDESPGVRYIHGDYQHLSEQDRRSGRITLVMSRR